MNTLLLIDIFLALILLLLVFLSITANSLFKSVMYFICAGLMLSLIWIRLGAIDIALAEAAIGAGITGVLLLDGLHHLSRKKEHL